MQASPEQQQIVRQFQAMRAECNELVQKITELEIERNEHKYEIIFLFIYLCIYVCI